MKENGIPPCPPGTAYTQVVTQRHLDECMRELGRPLWDFELKILDSIMAKAQKGNGHKVKKFWQGNLHALGQVKSLDEIVHLFCDRVKTKEHDAQVERAAQQAKATIYDKLTEVANDR